MQYDADSLPVASLGVKAAEDDERGSSGGGRPLLSKSTSHALLGSPVPIEFKSLSTETDPGLTERVEGLGVSGAGLRVMATMHPPRNMQQAPATTTHNDQPRSYFVDIGSPL